MCPHKYQPRDVRVSIPSRTFNSVDSTSMIPRSESEESLLTLFSATSPAEMDNASIFSEETVSAALTPIFGRKLLSYTRIRAMTLVMGQIKLDLRLYSSPKALKDDEPPMLTIQLNKLHFLKKNAPLLTTYYHNGIEKVEFSKVYFKILLNNLTCYVMMFLGGEKLVLFNDALKPHADAIYKGTKLRVFGASGASSTFGNRLIRLFLLNNLSPTLADGIDLEKVDSASSIKEMDLTGICSNPLYEAVTRQKRSELLQLLSQATPLVNIPYASYVDSGDEKLEGAKVTGTLRLFESVSESEDEGISPTSLIMANMMMFLIEQELRKMLGTSKPLIVRGKSGEK